MPKWWRNATDIITHGPHYDVKGHLKHVQKLWQSYPWRDEDTCVKVVTDIVLSESVPPYFQVALCTCLIRVLEDEDYFNYDQPTLESTSHLNRLQKRLSGTPEPAFAEIRRLVRDLARILPAHTTSHFSLPLSDYLGRYFISLPFNLSTTTNAGDDLFFWLKLQLHHNLIRLNGYDPGSYKDQRLKPIDDFTDAQLYKTLLDETPFQALASRPVPFSIERKRFASHGIIVAPPNHGKTQLFSTLISDFLADPQPPGLIVLDPHGDLFDTLRTRVDPTRLVLLDPDTDPPPLNFLDFGNSTASAALQTFEYLMSAISGGLTDKQAGIVPYLLKLLRVIPKPSLMTLRDIVNEKPRKGQQLQFAEYIEQLPEHDRSFFHNQFYGSNMQPSKDAISWKLYAATSSDAFCEMFAADSNNLDADRLLNEQKVVLVKGARRSLGEHGMQVFLQFVVSQFYAAALRRENIAPEKRRPCILFADEAHHVFNPQIANVLTECRKYALGFVGATQIIEQIPTEVKAAIYGATAIKIAGPVSHSDAFTLAREMHADGEALRALKSNERSHAEWMCYVQNETPRAVKITAAFGVLDKLPQYPPPPPRPRAPAAAASSKPTSPPSVPTAPRSQPPPSLAPTPPAAKRPQADQRGAPRNKPAENRDTEY